MSPKHTTSIAPEADRLARRRVVQAAAAAVAAGFGSSGWSASPVNEADLRAARDAAASANWSGPEVRGSGWLEWRMKAPSAWSALQSNPFDEAQVDLWVEFEGPGGQRLRATAFWMKDREGRGWAVRLMPTAAGTWKARTQMRMAGGSPVAVGEPMSFEVRQLSPKRRIGIDAKHPGYFAFEDGSPFVPVGLNVAWGGGGSALEDYKRWFRRLAENGGNFARLWMSSWAFGIEWKDTPLGDYAARMDRANLLDQVLELAESHGIRIMLCLLNHGAFSVGADAEWADNPYNAANGGPLKEPEEFVSNTRAKALFARRVRYIAARWSHSPALHSWEWWNEVNWTPIHDDELVPWIREMSAVLDRHDPYRRLRSTSWAHRGAAQVWAMPEIDFAQQHDYTTRDLSLHYASQYREFREEVPAKPLLPAELGMETAYDAGAKRPFNWDAVHLHNGLWAPIFRGYAGTALYWWWDMLVDPQKLWSTYRGISRFIDRVQEREPLAAHRPHPAQLSSKEGTALALVGPATVLLWVRANLLDAAALQAAYKEDHEDAPAAKWTPPWKPITGAVVRCTGLRMPDGNVRVRWFDTVTGQWLGQAPFSASINDGVLSAECPAFERDVAAIVQLSGAKG